ncbi:Sef1p [Sugiyamaella lignohabitans]|uniref:Sef1p n=1 Tax=Sugiyamaella lignohabitans TaxID=796027 RepID=A0A167F9U4_9ASCO|nr:Sef1p [Sugiyamaella lignohabitans]ANB15009.1 Sef1p [Sugiyamaella lignohabitans]
MSFSTVNTGGDNGIGADRSAGLENSRPGTDGRASNTFSTTGSQSGSDLAHPEQISSGSVQIPSASGSEKFDGAVADNQGLIPVSTTANNGSLPGASSNVGQSGNGNFATPSSFTPGRISNGFVPVLSNNVSDELAGSKDSSGFNLGVKRERERERGHNGGERDPEQDDVISNRQNNYDEPESDSGGESPDGVGGGLQGGLSQNADNKRHSHRSRPIRACTHCRQQKIKCNASETFPVPCSRCQRMGRKCIVDPLFRPHKGGQVQSLREDLSSLRKQVESLQKRESMLVSVIAQTNPDSPLITSGIVNNGASGISTAPSGSSPLNHLARNSPNSNVITSPESPSSTVSANSKAAAHDLLGLQSQHQQQHQSHHQSQNQPQHQSQHQSHYQQSPSQSHPFSQSHTQAPARSYSQSKPQGAHSPYGHINSPNNQLAPLQSRSSPSLGPIGSSAPVSNNGYTHPDSLPPISSVTTPGAQSPGGGALPPPPTTLLHRSSSVSTTASTATTSNKEVVVVEYTVGDVKLSGQRAEELHRRFITDFLPYVPIIESNSAEELYKQSHLLFWTVILTASLSEPEPSLYYSLCNLIKQMAIEACWLQTPRSTHVVQALCILGIWPLPNEKVLDDCSYRFVNLAKSVAMQLGLHRGKFIYEFSRSQTSLPDAEKWRTRTWLCIYFAEQVWSASLGLPPNTQVDYLLDTSTRDELLPRSFRSLLILSIFYSKLATLMGSSITSPDGLLDAPSRCSTLYFLEQELDRLGKTLEIGTDPSVELYYRYMKLMLCVFAFLPGTSSEDQAKYIVTAFQNGTRIVTIMSGLVEHRRLIEYPIYMRHAVSFAALILFRLHLSPLLLPQYVESARQSVVTVHRLFRNMLTAWKDLENDISRTAKVLEKLNFVIITHPYLLTQSSGIITRMRSHLTASLFYELIWAVHEARRRGAPIKGGSNLATHDPSSTNSPEPSSAAGSTQQVPQPLVGPNPPQFNHLESVPPLPFYNQITKDDFTTNTITTPNGTTITTLVPTHPNAALTVFGEGSGSVTPGVAGASGPGGATANANSSRASNLHNLTNAHGESNSSNTSSNLNNANANNSSMAMPRTPGTTRAIGIAQSPRFDPPTPLRDMYGTNASTAVHPSAAASFLDSTGASNDPLHLETLMQGIDWMNDNSDDFLGWMDLNIDN